MTGYLPVVIYLGLIVAFGVVSLLMAAVLDALAVFLIPWTLTLRGLGLRAVGTMAVFLAILSLGWVYALKEGILEWK